MGGGSGREKRGRGGLEKWQGERSDGMRGGGKRGGVRGAMGWEDWRGGRSGGVGGMVG